MLIAFCAVGIVLWIGGHDGAERGAPHRREALGVRVPARVASGVRDGVLVLGDCKRSRPAAEPADRAAGYSSPQIVRAPGRPFHCNATAGDVEFDTSLCLPARPGAAALDVSFSFLAAVAPGEASGAGRTSVGRAGNSTVFALLLALL